MRKISSLIATLFVAFTVFSCQPSADTSSEGMVEATFEVNGNCGMCKKTIEKSLADFPGVGTADWNVDTDMLTVSYDTSATSLQKIGERVASVGYENEYAEASEEAYDELAPCCQYDKREM